VLTGRFLEIGRQRWIAPFSSAVDFRFSRGCVSSPRLVRAE